MILTKTLVKTLVEKDTMFMHGKKIIVSGGEPIELSELLTTLDSTKPI